MATAGVRLDRLEFNAPPDTVLVISEAVFTANHLTVTDKQLEWDFYTVNVISDGEPTVKRH